MAPNIQQRLQGAWDNVSAAVLAQPGPFDPQTHLSNFLQNLAHRPSSPPQHDSGFRLHFPFPFAGLFLNRENKSGSSSTSNGDTPKQALISMDGKEGSQSVRRGPSRSTEEHVHGRDGHENSITIPTELRLLQKQLETSDLGFSGPASKEVLGRATWIFLHTLAAQ